MRFFILRAPFFPFEPLACFACTHEMCGVIQTWILVMQGVVPFDKELLCIYAAEQHAVLSTATTCSAEHCSAIVSCCFISLRPTCHGHRVTCVATLASLLM